MPEPNDKVLLVEFKKLNQGVEMLYEHLQKKRVVELRLFCISAMCVLINMNTIVDIDELQKEIARFAKYAIFSLYQDAGFQDGDADLSRLSNLEDAFRLRYEIYGTNIFEFVKNTDLEKGALLLTDLDHHVGGERDMFSLQPALVKLSELLVRCVNTLRKNQGNKN